MTHVRALLMVAVIAAALAFGLLRLGAPGHSPLPLATMAAPTARDRILLIAPHCDDETLGAGEVLASAVRAGSEVRVLLDTNGDGFHYGAERLFRERRVPPLDYVRMGLDRQHETIAALSELGVPHEAVSFLSYPDAGTAAMWLEYWDPAHPYTSPQTRDNHSPYPDAFTPYAPYAGRSLLDDLKTIIADFKPTLVLCPHPNDEHPDHWAAYCYTAGALYELGLLDAIPVRLYLVHRGDWPTPRGLDRRLPLLPPADLAGPNTRWLSFPATSATELAKYKAILRYRSQLLVMRNFLFSFARRNELFGEMPRGQLALVAPGVIRVDGAAEDWGRMAPAILDPKESRDKAPPSADVLAVYAATDGRHLYLRIDLAQPATPEVAYRILLHALIGKTVGPPQQYTLRLGDEAGRVGARFAGDHIEVSLPMSQTQDLRGVMLAVETAEGERKLDQTAWALLRTEARR